MTNRELAWRVFAKEYNASTFELASNQEREPGYLVTPLGAKINRIYIVGVLTELEKLEKNGNTYYRARVSDRTGIFYLYAGQYDAEVIKVLSKLEPPAYVAVVGKSRRYSPSEDISYVSIRPESITVVDKNVRDYWLLDASKSMKLRLEAMIEAQNLAQPNVEKLEALGFNRTFAAGIIDAMEHYKRLDIGLYRNTLFEVLKYLVTSNENGSINSGDDPDTKLKDLNTEFRSGEKYTEDEDKEDYEFEPSTETDLDDPELLELQNSLFEIICSYNGKKYLDGVPWHELVVKANSEGIDKNIIEDLVNDLLNKGKIYEPMLGKIKANNL